MLISASGELIRRAIESRSNGRAENDAGCHDYKPGLPTM